MVDRSDVERQSIFSILFTISVPRVHKGRKKQRSIDILLATSILMNDENAILLVSYFLHKRSDVETMIIFCIEFVKDCCSFYLCNCAILNTCFILSLRIITSLF